jgi:hypothetical protein
MVTPLSCTCGANQPCAPLCPTIDLRSFLLGAGTFAAVQLFTAAFIAICVS